MTFIAEFPDEPLPRLDVSLLAEGPSAYAPDPTIRTISVDVMTVSGSTVTPLQDINVFYDDEVVVIIHRKKSTSSGLVATSIWAWIGKGSRHGDEEKSKLTEMASRYGTTFVSRP